MISNGILNDVIAHKNETKYSNNVNDISNIFKVNIEDVNNNNAPDILDEEVVVCSYCNQPTYEESYILLSCLHRYHYYCVLSNITAVSDCGDFMVCKVCGFKSAVLGKTGIPVVRELGSAFNRSYFGSQPKSNCSTCLFRIPDVYCIDCCENFCIRCAKEFHNSFSSLQNHIFRQLESNEQHLVVKNVKNLQHTAKKERILLGINGNTDEANNKLQKKKKQSAEEYCIVHKNSKANYFCLTCEHNCFCDVCATIGMHRDHKVLMANEAIDCIRDVLVQFQNFAIKRITELDSVQDSTSEWLKRQQKFMEEVKPQLETNSVQACQILSDNTEKFKNELLKEWFDGEDIVLKEINDSKKKLDEIKQLIILLQTCLDKGDDYLMMNFLHEKYKEVYMWLDRPFNEDDFTKFTDPIICYERLYNMTDKINKETTNLMSQQIALNRLNCIFQPRKFQCNYESDIITFDDDGIAIPILSSDKISYSSNLEETKNSEKSIIKIGNEIFNRNLFGRKRQDIQIEQSVKLEITQNDNDSEELEDNSYCALYERMKWLHPKDDSLDQDKLDDEEKKELNKPSQDCDSKNNLREETTDVSNDIFQNEELEYSRVNRFIEHQKDVPYMTNLCIDIESECINIFPRFDILYSKME
ncbi:ring finger and bbox containing protein [Cryptosporidium ryanae]|uniref:ring finger and bbox containing protein n=1 Tax=Cryptosporidium ryanae TaxID=515981 RepID=UPI00351A1ECF|nr:ring finger and bbox containing protein [Cryptosporidium ryanae]